MYHPLVPAIGFVLLAGMTWLYATGSDLYGRILGYWTFIPWSHPFIDTAVIPLWISCWHRHGPVVFTDASWSACGLGPLNYSPLWLRMPLMPTDPAFVNVLGLSLVSVFLLSHGLLPQARGAADRALTILATFSCLPVFAMERGNLDLIIYVLAIGMAYCLEGPLGRRIFGYSLMVLGGLLKFYPLVALVLMLRERIALLIALGFAAAAVVGGTALYLLDELRGMAPVPGGAPFHNLWGARNLTTGFPVVMREFLRAAGLSAPMSEMLSAPKFVSAIAAGLLLTAMLIIVPRLVNNADLRIDLARIPARAHRLLLIGGALVVGCFFAGQNVGYRGIFLLLVLPAILALKRQSINTVLRRVWILTISAMLCVLWELTIRHFVADVFGGSYFPVEGSLSGYAVWLIQELAWWWLVTVLVAILIRFVIESPIFHLTATRAAARVCRCE